MTVCSAGVAWVKEAVGVDEGAADACGRFSVSLLVALASPVFGDIMCVKRDVQHRKRDA